MILHVATPLHDGRVHSLYLAGALESMRDFAGAVRFDSTVGSHISLNRTRLTRRFLESDATHLLFVDSDIGWRSSDVRALLDANVEGVSGCYVRRSEGTVPARVLEGGESVGPVVECDLLPAGFLLLARAGVERTWNHYGAEAWCFDYSPELGHVGEDYAFSRRWCELGGRLWLHTGVKLLHCGDHAFAVPGDS